MAYDEGLEQRIDELTSQWDTDLIKKAMFGGIGYMTGGNMCFGIHRNELIIRAREDQGEELLKGTGIRVFDMMTGRPQRNWFRAAPETFDTDIKLSELLEIGRDFSLSLPRKETKR